MEIDWTKSVQQPVNFSETAIEAFVAAHGDEDICCVFYDSDPKHGYVMVGFDTPAANRSAMMKLQKVAHESRQLNLAADAWESAKYFVTTPVLSTFNTNSAEFAYSEFAQIHFESWVTARLSPGYPQGTELSDDYLDGNFRVIIWKAVEALVAKNSFAPLKQAEIFVIGYSLHDQEESILYLQSNTKIRSESGRGRD